MGEGIHALSQTRAFHFFNASVHVQADKATNATAATDRKQFIIRLWKLPHSPSRDAVRCKIVAIIKSEQEADLNATHFRRRAYRAREMAQMGDDPRLKRMLLEVAQELEAEADQIDAETGVAGQDTAAADTPAAASCNAKPQTGRTSYSYAVWRE